MRKNQRDVDGGSAAGGIWWIEILHILTPQKTFKIAKKFDKQLKNKSSGKDKDRLKPAKKSIQKQ